MNLFFYRPKYRQKSALNTKSTSNLNGFSIKKLFAKQALTYTGQLVDDATRIINHLT
jgi:hypothetical protein